MVAKCLAELAADSTIILFTCLVPMLVWFALNILQTRLASASCKLASHANKLDLSFLILYLLITITNQYS